MQNEKKNRKYPGVFDYYSAEQFSTNNMNSTVHMNTYWICTDGEFMRAKKTGIWQYHTSEQIAKSISEQLPGTEVVFMKFVYIPFNPEKSE